MNYLSLQARICTLFMLYMAFAVLPLLGQSPQPPLPRRAPALASWTIQYKYPDQARKVNPGEPAPYFGDRIQTVIVTKTNGVYREQITLTSGKQYEKWIFGGSEIRTVPDSASILMISPPTAADPSPDYSDYGQSDFDGLKWLSPDKCKGTESYEGKQAFRFETVGKNAYLTTDTLLPLFVSDEQSSRTFTFNSPPTAALEPPKAFRDIIEKYKRGVENMRYHPVKM
jgi:hypothetical protein